MDSCLTPSSLCCRPPSLKCYNSMFVWALPPLVFALSDIKWHSCDGCCLTLSFLLNISFTAAAFSSVVEKPANIQQLMACTHTCCLRVCVLLMCQREQVVRHFYDRDVTLHASHMSDTSGSVCLLCWKSQKDAAPHHHSRSPTSGSFTVSEPSS